MKNKIFRILLLTFILGFVVSCEVDDNVENLVPAEEADLGSLITIDGTGKVLGSPLNPNDLVNEGVSIQQFVVNFDVEAYYKDIPDQVVQYEIFKQLNGGEKVSVATFDDLSYNYSFSGLDELLSGLGVSESDLRIGDVFTFTVQMTQQSGDVYQALPSFSATVNCLSDLAGSYNVVTTNITAGSVQDHGVELITEVSPGKYKTETTGLWTKGSLVADQGYYFEDVCGTINLTPDQTLFDYYSNAVTGPQEGFVDGATGVITVYYTIDFSAGANEYKSVYTPTP